MLQREKVTAPFLAATFEVSRRSINRDIEALCRAGIPISTSQGAGGGLAIMSGYRVDKALLTSGDMQAILAGLRSLDSVSGTNRYSQLMEKLAGPKLMAQEGSLLIDLASWYKGPLSEKLGLLQEAISGCRLAGFRYYGPGGESRRTVEPYYIVFRWGSWYVWGFCLKRNDYRLFKLNRMAGLTLVEEYGEGCFTVEPDGRCRFQIDFTNLDSAVDWLLEFRGDAELIGPSEVREELLKMGRKIIERYGKT